MLKMAKEDTKGAVWQKLLPAERCVRINIVSSHPQSAAEKKVEVVEGEVNGVRNGGRGRNASTWMHLTGWASALPQRSFRQHANSNTSSFSADGELATSPKDKDPHKQPSSPLMRYRSSRWSSRRVRKRVVLKNGECNVVQSNVAKRRRRYLADIFTTMVDIQWRWTVLIFTLSFILSWLAFAVLWWIISVTHGDFEIEHLPNNQESSGWKPCVANVYSFASCFLFSIETQHTIGYGARYTTEECPEAIFVMCIQSIIGVMIQAFMVGVVFSKLTRPKMRAQTLLFSRNAVICQRDGQLCLLFRVGDMRKSHIIGASIRAQLIQMRVTSEGEQMPYYQHELKMAVDVDDSDIFFIWPTTVVHKITADSPLYNISASDLLKEKFEIVVILEGTIESTSMTTQARSSYLPSEILWGHRFEPLVSFRKDTGQYAVDYSLFNHTYEVDTPLCSSRDLNEFKKLKQENLTNNSSQLRSRPVSHSSSPQLHYNRNLLIDPSLMATPLMRGVTPLTLTTLPQMAIGMAAQQDQRRGDIDAESRTQ